MSVLGIGVASNCISLNHTPSSHANSYYLGLTFQIPIFIASGVFNPLMTKTASYRWCILLGFTFIVLGFGLYSILKPSTHTAAWIFIIAIPDWELVHLQCPNRMQCELQHTTASTMSAEPSPYNGLYERLAIVRPLNRRVGAS
jgi:hypothetical protein